MKKIISSLIITLLLVNVVICYAFEDVQNSSLKGAVDTLVEFQIISGYSDGTFKPDNTITRAEFAKIIIAATNNYIPVIKECSFEDVDNSHWANSFIAIAKNLNIISGTTATTFEPESKINYSQAVKMIVASLGFNQEALEQGGYPGGYIKVANDLGLLNEIQFSYDDYATRGNIARIVRNALDVEYYNIYLDEDGAVKREKSAITLFELHKQLAEFNNTESSETSGQDKLNSDEGENSVG